MIDLKITLPNNRNGISLSDDEKSRLGTISKTGSKGSKRDWDETGRGIMDIMISYFPDRETESFDPDMIPSYMGYLLRMGTDFPGTMKGNGPRIDGIETPSHNGKGYEKMRSILRSEMEEIGITHIDGKGWMREGTIIRFDTEDQSDE